MTTTAPDNAIPVAALSFRILVLPGDGIGREVIPAAVEVLRATGLPLSFTTAEAGWECFQQHGAIDRLGQEIDGAASNRLNAVGHFGVAGHEDDREAILTVGEGGLQLEAAQPGHPHVEDDAARYIRLQFREQTLRALVDAGREACR